ncbi:DUF4894 domain-containing protein [Pseudothermotoga thermarum]|nr:DUF4894 domain-containing protein [Pseudothermotoga thermarum]
MYNFKKAFVFVLTFYFITFAWFLYKLPYRVSFDRKEPEEKPAFVIAYKNRYWLVSENGDILGVAKLSDLATNAFVSQVDVVDLKVDKVSLETMKRLKIVLQSPYVTEVRLKDKCAILLKGVVLYFNEWNDLITHCSKLETAIRFMEPKSEYFLSPVGLFYKLRGDESEKK